MKLRLALLSVVLAVAFATPAYGQAGTQHGEKLTWQAPSPVGGSGTLAGYNAYRCPGTCTTSSTGWTKLTPSVVPTTTYLDPAAGLTLGNTYSYAVTSVDSVGSESAFSNIVTVTAPSGGFPTNPGTASGLSVSPV